MIDPNDPEIVLLQNEINNLQTQVTSLRNVTSTLIAAFLEHSHTDSDPFIPTTKGGGRYTQENFDA